MSVTMTSGNPRTSTAMTSPIRRIIIVDDHDAVRRGVHSLVETRPNYQVVGEASNGREAVNLAIETSPDIAIID